MNFLKFIFSLESFVYIATLLIGIIGTVNFSNYLVPNSIHCEDYLKCNNEIQYSKTLSNRLFDLVIENDFHYLFCDNGNCCSNYYFNDSVSNQIYFDNKLCPIYNITDTIINDCEVKTCYKKNGLTIAILFILLTGITTLFYISYMNKSFMIGESIKRCLGYNAVGKIIFVVVTIITCSLFVALVSLKHT